MTKAISKKISITVVTILILMSCENHNVILRDQNFDKGKWLLVDRSYITDTILAIYDKQLLKDNSKNFIVEYSKDDKGTTCDGVIQLYKNGILIKSQEYLSKSHVMEPTIFKKYYKPCKMIFKKTATKHIFNTTWDSLRIGSDTYPILNSDKPSDTSTVLYYKFENRIQ